MRKLTQIEAVLFDFDGTVVDSNEFIFSCLDYTARHHLGRAFPRQLLESNVGMPLADLFQSLHGAEAAAPQVEAMVHTYRRHQEEREHAITACDGIEAVLHTLRRSGVRLAIVTTKQHAVAARQLARVGLDACFDTIVGFDECQRAKPDPEPFLLALERLTIEPTRAVAVGDSAADICGARAAGVIAIGASWGCFSPAALAAAKPDATAATPPDLLRLLA